MIYYVVEVLFIRLLIRDDSLHFIELIGRYSVLLLGLELALHKLIDGKRIKDIHRNDIVAAETHNLLHLSRNKIFDSGTAHLCRQNSVAESRSTAALNMRKSCKAGFDARALFDHLAQFLAVILTHTLAGDDNEITLAAMTCLDHFFDNVVEIGGDFLYNCGNRAERNRGLERNIARISAHYLDNGTARMAFARIAELIDELKKQGVEVDLMPDDFTAEGLVEEFTKLNIKNKNIK